MATTRTPLWIDCDAGIDDAQAILMCIASSQVDVVGISCVAGNVGVQQVAQNVFRTLAAAGRPDIKVYLGAHEPMVAEISDATSFHGQDGFGENPSAHPAQLPLADLPLQPETACEALIQCARRHDGRLKVLALGPLTTLALAYKMQQALPSDLAALVVMGGASGKGNVTPLAEFNFHVDAHAAHIVMTKYERIDLVTWTLTLQNPVPWAHVTAYLATGTPASNLMASVMARDLKKWKGDTGYPSGWIACDPMAAAVVVAPATVTVSRMVSCDVLWADGETTRGQSVLNASASARQPGNVRLVDAVDMALFQKLFLSSVSSTQETSA